MQLKNNYNTTNNTATVTKVSNNTAPKISISDSYSSSNSLNFMDTSACNYITTSNISTNPYGYNSITTTPGIQQFHIGDFVESSILFLYLNESEIDEILEKMRPRLMPEDEERFKTYISSYVSTQHCSEDFILKYLPYLSWDQIKILHKKDIYTGKYASLKLALDLKD